MIPLIYSNISSFLIYTLGNSYLTPGYSNVYYMIFFVYPAGYKSYILKDILMCTT